MKFTNQRPQSQGIVDSVEWKTLKFNIKVTEQKQIKNLEKNTNPYDDDDLFTKRLQDTALNTVSDENILLNTYME